MNQLAACATYSPTKTDAVPQEEIYRLEHVGTPKQRFLFVLMQLVFLATLLRLSVQIISIFLSPLVSSTAVLAVLVAYCACAIFWQIVYVVRVLAMRRAALVDVRVPSGLRIAMATTIVPSREIELLRAKLEGMVHVDPCGNAIDHWVLDEEDDPRVKAVIEDFKRRYRRRGVRIFHFTRKGRSEYNEPARGRRFERFQERQKGGNINAWLDAISPDAYDVVTFLDLDHVPRRSFYRKVLPYFRDPGVGFVQGPESFRNRDENFITRAASLERDTFFGLIHRSYLGLGMPIVVGSHTTFRFETIRAVGGSYPVHLTEDYLIMLTLRALRQRGVFVDDVLAVGELPSTWSAYLGQQYRWASGGLDLLLRYWPGFFRTFTAKEKLFYFVLLNYYAWGTFYIAFKGLLFVLLLAGLSLHLEVALIVGIVVFTVVAAVANHLWERQFFIEPEKRSFLLENAVMNNFLGGLYCVALLKAIVAPNTPFAVTVKRGANRVGAASAGPYAIASYALFALEIAALGWACFRAGAGFGLDQITRNVLIYPLLLALIGNLFVLVSFRRMERPRTQAQKSRLRVFVGDSRAAAKQMADAQP